MHISDADLWRYDASAAGIVTDKSSSTREVVLGTAQKSHDITANRTGLMGANLSRDTGAKAKGDAF